jgi:transposase-like protein
MIEDICRKGAQRMLQVAIEQEVADFVEKHTELIDADGHRLVVRNGYKPERNIITGIGPIAVNPPRVDDRKLASETDRPRFTSEILPRYMRRVPSIDNLIPILYLKGISTGEFPDALKSIIGVNAAGVSPATVTRLKAAWEDEYKEWAKRDLSQKEYVYFWADGVYSGIRMEDDKACMLVIIAADSKGDKELLAIEDGLRESKISWHNLLLDLKKRGLTRRPKLAIGDGALGFWAACAKYTQAHKNRDVGFTKQLTYLINCQKVYKPMQNR